MFRPRIILLAIALVTVLAYLPVLQDGFLNYDDTQYLVNNVNIQNGLSWAEVKWAFTSFYCSNWHPLTWIGHSINFELFRLNPAGHHFINVLVHAANACLLFVLMFRLIGLLWPSAFVAALFALHPLHVESVAWIAEFKDVSSTFWGLLALLAYAHYTGNDGIEISLEKENKTGNAVLARNHRRVLFYWLALACFAMSLMCKSMLVTLPFVMLLLDWWPLKRMQAVTRCVVEKIPFVLLSVGVSILTFQAQRATAMASLIDVPLHTRLENAAVAYCGYLEKVIWPANLAILYPLSVEISTWKFVIALMAVLIVFTLVLLAMRSQPWLTVGLFWYFGTLIPVIGIVQVGSQAMADRYTYFPTIGIFFAATLTIAYYANRFRIPTVLPASSAAIVLGLCLIRTQDQLQYWRDTKTMFAHTLEVTGNNPLCHLKIGEVYENENMLDEALAEYQLALSLNNIQPSIYNAIGRILSEQNRFQEAVDAFHAAVKLKPEEPGFHDSLGIALIELGRFKEAENEFSEAIRLQPTYAPANFQMGRALLKQGSGTEAMKYFQEALRLEPNNLQMLVYVARVLAADTDATVRNGIEACKFAERAAGLRSGKQPFVLDTLAAAYAEAGRFDDAINKEKQAIKLGEEMGLNDDRDAMQRRLALYVTHQPWRESFRPKNTGVGR